MRQKREMRLCESHDHGVKTETVQITELYDFKGHPFKVEWDVALFELSKSIEDKGILVPLLVRKNPHGKGYEIISGHRRKEASLWAVLESVPVMIADKECDDLIDENGWIEIEDPLPDCQHDAFIPLRVKGRSTGKPEWGKIETLKDGEWVEYK